MDGYRFGFKNIGDKIPGRPQPLMSKGTPTKPLKWHWGVISHVGRRKNTALSQPTFVPEGESLRRPDIVVVRDPSMPPVENNIAMIYEMKFNEKVDRDQEASYRRIVNNDVNRVQTIEVKDCRCEKRTERVREVTREELLAWAAAMAAALAAASKSGDGGPTPGLKPSEIGLGLAIVGGLALGFFLLVGAPVEIPAGVAAFIVLMFGAGRAAPPAGGRRAD